MENFTMDHPTSNVMLQEGTTIPWVYMNTADYFEVDEKLERIATFLYVFTIVVYIVIFLLGATGNGLVIFFTIFKMKRTVNVVWFLNLAIAGFIFTLFLPLSIAHAALDFHWPFGRFMCKLNTTIIFINLYASVFNLTVISIDRCISVMFPVWCQNHRTPRLASFVALTVWILALIFSLPYFIFRDTEDYEGFVVCYNNFHEDENIRYLRQNATVVVRFIVGFLIPFTVIILCYSVIIFRIQRNHMTTSSRPFKVILAVIISFLFLCFPYHVFSFLELSAYNDNNYQFLNVVFIGMPFCISLTFMNNCINPVLYVFIDRDFKQKFLSSLRSMFQRVFMSFTNLEELARPLTQFESLLTEADRSRRVISQIYSILIQGLYDKPPTISQPLTCPGTMENFTMTHPTSDVMLQEETVIPWACVSTADYNEEDEKLKHIANVFRVFSIVVYTVAFLLGTTGNGLVIFFTAFKMKRTVNVVWFLNLAITDFIFTFFLPLSVTYAALEFHWPFGPFMCRLSSSIGYFTFYASVFQLTVISIDRCISVVYPVWCQNHRTPRLASFVALAVWILAFVFSSPHFIFQDTEIHEDFVISDYNFHKNKHFSYLRLKAIVVVRFIVSFVIPFTVIILCYSVIYLRIQRNHMTTSSRPFRVILAVIISFFFCWFPSHVFDILELSALNGNNYQLAYVVYVGKPFTLSLAFINSCINPVLYVFIGRDFKQKFHSSLRPIFERAFLEESVQTDSRRKTQSIPDS
ncbi:uncharacterized protein ACMZJ9_019029 [Mantella aurantiaca]